MKKTQKIIVILAILITAVKLQANTFSYQYDANGNRTARTFYFQKISVNNDSIESKKIDTIHTVNMYPNPTEGNFSINITNINENTQGYIKIYSFEGTELINNPKLESSNSFDFTKNANGVYFIKIEIDGIVSSYKLIKYK